MNKFQKRLTVIILGIIIGISSYYVSRYITLHYFRVGWLNLLPWMIGGLAVGYLSSERKESLLNGAFYGYFIFFSYILVDYRGKSDMVTIAKLIIITLLFSLIGGVAGIVGGLVGNFIRRKVF